MVPQRQLPARAGSRDGGRAEQQARAVPAGPGAELAAERVRLRDAARRLAEGELGSLRVLIVLAIIWTIFTIANDRSLTAVSLTHLAPQIAAVATISIGVVLVLLLGEIDVSVGAVSGLAGAATATLSVKSGWCAVLGALVIGSISNARRCARTGPGHRSLCEWRSRLPAPTHTGSISSGLPMWLTQLTRSISSARVSSRALSDRLKSRP
jgi:hypothetical protein